MGTDLVRVSKSDLMEGIDRSLSLLLLYPQAQNTPWRLEAYRCFKEHSQRKTDRVLICIWPHPS